MKVILTSFKKQGKNGYSNDQEKSSHKQLHDDQRMIGLIYIKLYSCHHSIYRISGLTLRNSFAYNHP